MKQPVAQAVEEIRAAFPDAEVTVRDDEQGGAYVVVEPVDPGGIYQQRETWIGFRITFQYPYADVYPHFVRESLKRVDGKSVTGSGIQSGRSFEGRPALQISRRSNRLNPERDRALLKLQKVLQWLGSRP